MIMIFHKEKKSQNLLKFYDLNLWEIQIILRMKSKYLQQRPSQ